MFNVTHDDVLLQRDLNDCSLERALLLAERKKALEIIEKCELQPEVKSVLIWFMRKVS